MDGSRAVRLAAKRVFEKIRGEHRVVDLVPPVSIRRRVFARGAPEKVERDREARPLLVEVTDDSLAIAVYPNGTVHNVPYALVKSIWLTSDMRPAISMDARIVRDDADEASGYYLDAP